MTRPRTTASDSWRSIATSIAWKYADAIPMGTIDTTNQANVGASPSEVSAPHITTRLAATRALLGATPAAKYAPISVPTLLTPNMRPIESAPRSKVNSTTDGTVTRKLYEMVPMTSITTIGVRTRGVARTYRNPSRMPPCARVSMARTRISRARMSASATSNNPNDEAFTKKHTATPAWVTRKPASAGPAMRAVPLTVLAMAMALWVCSLGTSCGANACMVVRSNALTDPNATVMRSIVRMLTLPVYASTP